MKSILLILIFSGIISTTFAQTVTWRGANSSGIFSDTNLLREWPENGPEKIIQIDSIGLGWGSAIIHNNEIFVIGRKDTLDYLSSYSLDGHLNWEVPIGPSWDKSFKDSRSTPTINGDRIYSMSGLGHLSCFQLENGHTVWSQNIDSIFNTEWHRWGNSETPLIVDNMVISTPSGAETAMVALDKKTGKVIWKSESLGDQRSYATPVRYKNDSVDQIIGLTSKKIYGVETSTGRIMWHYNLSERIAELDNQKVKDYINANSPLIKGNRVYSSQGYNSMGVMLEITGKGDEIKEIWVDRTLDNHHHGLVELNGKIYGSNWYNNRDGRWVTLDWNTGEVLELKEWNIKGVTIAADEMLYLYNEKPGIVALAKPLKDGIEIVSSFEVDYGKNQHWAHPFIGEGKLLIRHGESIGVYNISSE